MIKKQVMEICTRYGLSPNKRLGQNFLVDEALTLKIVDAVNAGPVDSICEIGPGLGALTEYLVSQAGCLTAVEIDAGLSRVLHDRFQQRSNFTLLHNDFLKIDTGNSFSKVVSNLPYYCSSEIMFKVASQLTHAQECYVMLQKEMADRITASPGNKNYGALTVSLNLYFSVQALLNVGPHCFYPRPEVLSRFLKLVRRSRPSLCADTIDTFHAVVKSAFWGRRKTILKSLTGSPHLHYSRDTIADALRYAHIRENQRGEELSLDTYITLAEYLHGK